jgi:hemerythrin-like metal-binding protein
MNKSKEFMPWKSSYSVGEHSIDAQHKQIIELINDLHRVLNSQQEGSRARIKAVLDQLVHYTVTHFQHEEQVMLECGYPDLNNHKAIHSQLKRRTVAMCAHLEALTERDVLSYLRDWWSGHILEHDKAYAPFLTVAVR